MTRRSKRIKDLERQIDLLRVQVKEREESIARLQERIAHLTAQRPVDMSDNPLTLDDVFA